MRLILPPYIVKFLIPAWENVKEKELSIMKFSISMMEVIDNRLIEEFARKLIAYIRFGRNFERENWHLGWFKYASGMRWWSWSGSPASTILDSLFLAAYNEGYDIVSGQRTRGESFCRSSFTFVCFLSNRSMDVHLTDGIELRLPSQQWKLNIVNARNAIV